MQSASGPEGGAEHGAVAEAEVTLLTVAEEREVFQKAVEYLRGLTQREIADAVGIRGSNLSFLMHNYSYTTHLRPGKERLGLTAKLCYERAEVLNALGDELMVASENARPIGGPGMGGRVSPRLRELTTNAG